MPRNQRIALLAVAVAVIVVAFIVLRPADEAATPTATTPAQTQPAPATTTEPEPEPEPEFTTIRIRDTQPAGEVRDIEVQTGDRVRLAFDSDVAEEIHIHGYDRYIDLIPNETVRESFTADAEGIFEIELHGSGALVANLEVRPD